MARALLDAPSAAETFNPFDVMTGYFAALRREAEAEEAAGYVPPTAEERDALKRARERFVPTHHIPSRRVLPGSPSVLGPVGRELRPIRVVRRKRAARGFPRGRAGRRAQARAPSRRDDDSELAATVAPAEAVA